jgi:hypothetical protein
MITWFGFASLPPSIKIDNEPSRSLLWAENDLDRIPPKRRKTPK